MQNILKEAVEKVENGAKFFVDFYKKNLKINSSLIIKEGKFDGELGVEKATTEEVLQFATELFQQYYHSIPSERSSQRRKQYFSALPLDSLSEEDMMYGERREIALARLEIYLLCNILAGNLKWEDLPEHCRYYWQSKENKAFVILKSWI